MLLKLLLLITTTLLSLATYGASEKVSGDKKTARDDLLFEKQEVILAQAELELLDDGVKAALNIIAENLDSQQFHLPSFLFLAKLHEKIGNNSRSMRVYYYAIRRMHGRDLLAADSGERLQAALEKMPKPKDEVMEVYIKIAQIYNKMAEGGDYPTSFTPRLTNLALKYYRICEHYKYQLPTVIFQIAQIKRQQKKFVEAINLYWEAKELLGDNEQNRAQVDTIDYLLGASLISAGRRNAGAEYLKNIHKAEGVSSSLKGYANDYLDALSYNYTMLSATLYSEYTKNYYGASDAEIADNPANSQSAWTDSVYVMFYYTSQSYKNWSYSLTPTWSESKLKDDRFSSADSRSIALYTELQNNTFTSFIFKLSYGYSYGSSRSGLRSAPGSRLEKSYVAHTLTPKMSHTIKQGSFSYSIMLYSYHQADAETVPPIYRTYSASYTPFSTSEYFSPSYSLSYSVNDSGRDYTNDLINISVSNHLSLMRTLSLFGSVDVTDSRSDAPDSGSSNYISYSLSATLNYITPLSDSLTAALNATRSLTVPDADEEDDHINNWTAKLSLSYNF
jgi:hypothetical protein